MGGACLHYKIKYSYAVVCWIGPGGRCLGDMSQDTYESCITYGLLFGEQRSTMAGKVCLSAYMLGVCVINGWGTCMLASVLHFCYTQLWVYTIHPLLHYVGTTGKGYFRTLLYFVVYMYA